MIRFPLNRARPVLERSRSVVGSSLPGLCKVIAYFADMIASDGLVTVLDRFVVLSLGIRLSITHFGLSAESTGDGWKAKLQRYAKI